MPYTLEYLETGWHLTEGADEMKYAVVIEDAGPNFAAYVPDLPGCVAVGDTLEEVEREIQEAIRFHIEGMVEDGETPPAPRTVVEYILAS